MCVSAVPRRDCHGRGPRPCGMGGGPRSIMGANASAEWVTCMAPPTQRKNTAPCAHANSDIT